MTLKIAYFPPVEYFALLAKYSSVYIEACENYQKQSYRNRCHIYAENGIQALNFPVKHENGTFSLPITHIKVDYSTPWVKKTIKCIDSAYMSSAFYEYYRDELASILESEPQTLWDLDISLIHFFMRKIGLNTTLMQTTAFDESCKEEIHPKKPNSILKDLGVDKSYYQVFAQRHGFIPNLSIMDLLFNEGPASIDYLL